jgi:signal transduction histidine kinase
MNIYGRNNELILSAADDGIGFNNFDRKREAKGYGLTGIETGCTC